MYTMRIVKLNKFISHIKNKFENALIYGLSPTHFLLNQESLGKTNSSTFVIGLNEAFVFHNVNCMVTIHPEVLYRYSEYLERLPQILVIGEEKFKKFISIINGNTDGCLDQSISKKILSALAGKEIVLFKYRLNHNTAPVYDPSNSGRNLFLFDMIAPNTDFLYVWSSISQTAMHLCYLMGVKHIQLLGCESIMFNSKYKIYGHTRWNGVPPNYRIKQYAQGNLEVAIKLRSKGVIVNSIVPFSSLFEVERQYNSLKCKLQLDKITAIPYPEKNRKFNDRVVFLRFVAEKYIPFAFNKRTNHFYKSSTIKIFYCVLACLGFVNNMKLFSIDRKGFWVAKKMVQYDVSNCKYEDFAIQYYSKLNTFGKNIRSIILCLKLIFSYKRSYICIHKGCISIF